VQLIHTLYRGSPPRVWGIPVQTSATDEQNRFTPTCVGNTERN
jgi:hypothetical protein